MDDTLRIIKHLYDEDLEDPSALRRIREDDTLRQELEELRSTKEILDRRFSPSPDPDVVDRVVNHAAEAASTTNDRRAGDRDPRPRERSLTGRMRTVSAVLTLLLFVGLGLWQFQTNGPSATDTASGEARKSVTSTVNEDRNPESVPEWNDRDEVVRLHRRVEQLRTRSRSGTWASDVQSVDQGPPSARP